MGGGSSAGANGERIARTSTWLGKTPVSVGAQESWGFCAAATAANAFAWAMDVAALVMTAAALLNAAARDGATPAGMTGGAMGAAVASTCGSGGGTTQTTHLRALPCRERPFGPTGGCAGEPEKERAADRPPLRSLRGPPPHLQLPRGARVGAPRFDGAVSCASKDDRPLAGLGVGGQVDDDAIADRGDGCAVREDRDDVVIGAAQPHHERAARVAREEQRLVIGEAEGCDAVLVAQEHARLGALGDVPDLHRWGGEAAVSGDRSTQQAGRRAP